MNRGGAMLRGLRRLDAVVGAWLLFGAVGIGIYFLLPSHDLQDLAYQGPGMLSVAAVLLGIRLHRPADRRPWILLAIGLALSTAGDWTWVLLDRVFAIDPFPSMADGFYLAGMGLVAVAVFGFARGRIPGGDRAGLLDALIVAAGVALLSWTFVMAPIVLDPTIGLFETAVALAYPILDVVLLGLLVRLVLVPGRLVPALGFLLAALVSLLVADFPFAILALEDGYNTGDLIEIGWLAAAFFWGAAALDPSMREIAQPVEATTPSLPAWRIALLGVASLTAPAILVLEWTTDQRIDVPVIAAGCVVLFGLVITRLGGVVSDLHTTLLQRQKLEQELEHRAHHDPLTGLANRVVLRQRLEAALGRPGVQVAVLFLDLDDFKGVNETYGHHAGDVLLSSVADELRGAVRPTDTVARLGGDEFAVLVVQGANAASASELSERLLAAIRGAGRVAGWDRPIGASIGISVGAGSAVTAEELMREADIAMYAAKSQGKGSAVVFDAQRHDSVARGTSVRAHLDEAIRERQFELHYQPIIDLGSGDLAGVEALVRWRHPTRGLLPPAAFIPAAETSGAIMELGAWVVGEAVRQAGAWRNTPRTAALMADGRFVSINLSAVQLRDPRLAATLRDALASAAIEPAQIVLELNESAETDIDSAARALSALAAIGVRLAIDDFGTGFATPARLLATPFAICKIDGSIVARIADDTRAEQLFGGMLELARRMDAVVIAEGIELPTQLSKVRQLGCTLAQGFYFSKPVPAEELETLFATAAASSRRTRAAARHPRAAH